MTSEGGAQPQARLPALGHGVGETVGVQYVRLQTQRSRPPQRKVTRR
ncbi:hypothetical protein HMPREF0972_02390 [Actinomyces sp. oral taxon 848 str. F0332]|nr:hypothetical protein HMPREF0972_02390 [Actinomyces sp. oral taxon 848 str. F0332]